MGCLLSQLARARVYTLASCKCAADAATLPRCLWHGPAALQLLAKDCFSRHDAVLVYTCSCHHGQTCKMLAFHVQLFTCQLLKQNLSVPPECLAAPACAPPGCRCQWWPVPAPSWSSPGQRTAGREGVAAGSHMWLGCTPLLKCSHVAVADVQVLCSRGVHPCL